MTRAVLRAAGLLPCLTLIGCVGGVDPSSDEAVGAVISSNRLSMNRLSMNRLSMNGLSQSRLSPDGLNLADTDLLLDETGRELLRYIVRCALPEGQTLVGTAGSATFAFDGLIGLQPEWLQRSLSEKDQRWISACLLAHVNGYGVEVPISLRGNHRALATNEDERNVYMNEEISFYGNVFLPVGRGDELGDIGRRMYACGSPLLQLSCGTSAFGPTRSCEVGLDCGIEFMGACRDVASFGAGVCEHAAEGGYGKCHSAGKDLRGKWPKERAYKEVVTVYLQNPELSSLYPSCGPLTP